ncbi:MAG: hypothetical protein SFY66_04375 [Oculatellaceae cyanobacterium bins.114]|nr:hypothetical protein [Oculatellaceae cyanobacterium bins.114]
MTREQEYIKRVALELLVDYVWAKQRQKERQQWQDDSTQLEPLQPL